MSPLINLGAFLLSVPGSSAPLAPKALRLSGHQELSPGQAPVAAACPCVPWVAGEANEAFCVTSGTKHFPRDTWKLLAWSAARAAGIAAMEPQLWAGLGMHTPSFGLGLQILTFGLAHDCKSRVLGWPGISNPEFWAAPGLPAPLLHGWG